MSERVPSDTVPERALPGAVDPLADLLALVTQRARGLEGDEAHEAGLARLREAVDALGGYLDLLDFLRRARAEPTAPDATNADAAPPDRAGAAPEAEGGASEADDGSVARTDGAHAGPDADPDAGPGVPGAAPEAAAGGTRLAATEAESSAAETEPVPTAPGVSPPPERAFAPYRDQLTGLHSREGFDAVAGGELKRCRRHGRIFGLLVFELGGLDEATLPRAAETLVSSIRESDLAGRRGPRALVVALPESRPTEARQVAERILRRFESSGLWGPWGRLALVAHPTHGESLRHLFEASRAQLTLPADRVLASADNGGWPG